MNRAIRSRCAAHADSRAVARCRRCDLALCDQCFRLLADGVPCCDACAMEISAGPPSRWPFAIAFLGMSLAICIAGVRLEGEDPTLLLWIPTALIALVTTVVIGLSGKSERTAPPATLSEREVDSEPSPALLRPATSPYRTRLSRVARRIVPLSGRSTAAVMTAAFALSAVVLAVGMKQPAWIEAELVLGVWWLGIAGLLAWLLFTGRRLALDYRLKLGRDEGGGDQEPSAKPKWTEAVGCADLGCFGEAIVIVLLLAVAALGAWLLVEVVLPVVVFAVYYFVTRAIGRVARDDHGCQGDLPRALLWGAAWSAVYVVPIAVLIGAVAALGALAR